mmetsp:Transcript_46632/g.87009  ORF Transcript_46632/g.87009 Transcript_46632/m.87009 type:complete len:378 (+) Transcript_46632:45-1178(+)
MKSVKLLAMLVLQLQSREIIAFLPSQGTAVARRSTLIGSLLYQDQEQAAVRDGERQKGMMLPPTPLHSLPLGEKATGTGFKKVSAKGEAKERGSALAAVLKREGVVRVDGALSAELCDELRAFVLSQRAQYVLDVESGVARQQERFSDVLLKGGDTRCDLRLPLEEPVLEALGQAFGRETSALSMLVEKVLTKKAVLRECASLVSSPGSHRQTCHSDTPYQKQPPLLTCFIALQDICDMDLGPTVFLPRTHTAAAHETFGQDNPAFRDEQLRTTPSVCGLLKKGDVAVFDSRLFHLGDANRSTDPPQDRVLFYATWRNPKVTSVGNPASIRPIYAEKLTLDDVRGYEAGGFAAAAEALRDEERQLEAARSKSLVGNN